MHPTESDPTTGTTGTTAEPTTAPPPGSVGPGRTSLGWTELVVGAVVYLALSILLGLALIPVLGDQEPHIALLVGLTGVVTLGAVAVALALRVRSLAAVGLRGTTVRWLLLGVAAGVLGWLVNRFVILAYVWITGDAGNPQQDLTDGAAPGGWGLVALLITGAVLVPFAEELLFRGIGYGSLRRYGVWVATIASALIFGIAHGVSVVLPAAIVLGLVNAVLYERSRSIWPSVIAHGVNNAIIFVSAAILL